MITPTHHEKLEWSRLASTAYHLGRNDVGHRFSVAASLPSNGQLTVRQYDSLQDGYREWLVFGGLLARA